VKTEENPVDLGHGRLSVVGYVVFEMNRATKGLVFGLFKVWSVSREGFPCVEQDIAVPRPFRQLLSASKCGWA
jgi:hypothetical protein